MIKLTMTLCLMIASSVIGFAQASDDYNKNEFFVGYSHQQVGTGNRVPFNGFEASYVRNVHRYFGIKADFSAAFRNLDFDITLTDPVTGTPSTGKLENNNSLHNFLGGVQVKDNRSQARFKPFAHALVGVAHNRRTGSVNCSPSASNCAAPAPFKSSATGFGGAFGGGLDIKINNRVDFRALQVDYNPVYTDRRLNNNFRFGIGFVFK